LGLSTEFSLTGFDVTEKLRPQTRQRVAFSLKRVPQVGQTFIVGFVLSGLIDFSRLNAALYHSGIFDFVSFSFGLDYVILPT